MSICFVMQRRYNTTFLTWTGVLRPSGNGLVNQTSTFTMAQLINRIPNDATGSYLKSLKLRRKISKFYENNSVGKSGAPVQFRLLFSNLTCRGNGWLKEYVIHYHTLNGTIMTKEYHLDKPEWNSKK